MSATAQVLIGPGPGGTVPIEYIEATGTRTIEAFPGFFGGTSVTLGDVNGDGPHVRVFSGTDLSDIASFHAFDPAFPCGVHVVAGDLNGAGAPRAGGVRQ